MANLVPSNPGEERKPDISAKKNTKAPKGDIIDFEQGEDGTWDDPGAKKPDTQAPAAPSNVPAAIAGAPTVSADPQAEETGPEVIGEDMPTNPTAPLAGAPAPNASEATAETTATSEQDNFFHIFRRADMDAIDADGHRVAEGALKNFHPLDYSSISYLAVRYPGYERNPAFIEQLKAQAAAKGMSLDEYLDTDEAQGPKGTVFAAFKDTSRLMQQPTEADPKLVPLVNVKLGPKGMFDRQIVPIFQDAEGTTYRDSGYGVTSRVPKGQKFSYANARNTSAIYIAGRHTPSSDGEQQTMRFELTSGRSFANNGLAAFARRKPHNHIMSLMVLASLQEAEMAGVRPALHEKSKFANAPIQKIGVTGDESGFKLDKDALEQARMHCPNIDSLIEKYNQGWPQVEGPTIGGEEIENKAQQTAPTPEDTAPKNAAELLAHKPDEQIRIGVPEAPKSLTEAPEDTQEQSQEAQAQDDPKLLVQPHKRLPRQTPRLPGPGGL